MLAAAQLGGKTLQNPSRVMKYPFAHCPHLTGNGDRQLGSLYSQTPFAFVVKYCLHLLQVANPWLRQLLSWHLPPFWNKLYLQVRQSPVWMLKASQKGDTWVQIPTFGKYLYTQTKHNPGFDWSGT